MVGRGGVGSSWLGSAATCESTQSSALVDGGGGKRRGFTTLPRGFLGSLTSPARSRSAVCSLVGSLSFLLRDAFFYQKVSHAFIKKRSLKYSNIKKIEPPETPGIKLLTTEPKQVSALTPGFLSDRFQKFCMTHFCLHSSTHGSF
jgi:hypothetical protein